MNFAERGSDILSCSALPRVRQCPGSFLLSKGCPDEPSEGALDGQRIHDHIEFLATKGKKGVLCDDLDLSVLADQMWGHARRSAAQYFGAQDEQLIWRSEERRWMADDNLEPILSGQFDVTCTVEDAGELLLYDFKSGYLAGDVAPAERNEQIEGMAAILQEETGLTVLAAIVRPWASDQLAKMRPEWIKPWVEEVYQYTDPFAAGLKKGAWCSYCPAKKAGRCPLFRDQLALVLKSEGLETTMESMAPDNLVRILRASAPAESVIAAAEKEARRRADAGIELPGVSWKPGNTKRTIADETKFGMAMLAEGIDLGEFQKTEIPLGASEKAWLKKKGLRADKSGKEAFNKAFKDFLEFGKNAPTLVIDN